ncbi:hypothetical protein WJX77_000231 [Trebouxia sp. C0004]
MHRRTSNDSRLLVGVQAQEQGQQILEFERVKTYDNQTLSLCISCSKDKLQMCVRPCRRKACRRPPGMYS